jgi:hypothetical protein
MKADVMIFGLGVMRVSGVLKKGTYVSYGSDGTLREARKGELAYGVVQGVECPEGCLHVMDEREV